MQPLDYESPKRRVKLADNYTQLRSVAAIDTFAQLVLVCMHARLVVNVTIASHLALYWKALTLPNGGEAILKSNAVTFIAVFIAAISFGFILLDSRLMAHIRRNREATLIDWPPGYWRMRWRLLAVFLLLSVVQCCVCSYVFKWHHVIDYGRVGLSLPRGKFELVAGAVVTGILMMLALRTDPKQWRRRNSGH